MIKIFCVVLIKKSYQAFNYLSRSSGIWETVFANKIPFWKCNLVNLCSLHLNTHVSYIPRGKRPLAKRKVVSASQFRVKVFIFEMFGHMAMAAAQDVVEHTDSRCLVPFSCPIVVLGWLSWHRDRRTPVDTQQRRGRRQSLVIQTQPNDPRPDSARVDHDRHRHLHLTRTWSVPFPARCEEAAGGALLKGEQRRKTTRRKTAWGVKPVGLPQPCSDSLFYLVISQTMRSQWKESPWTPKKYSTKFPALYWRLNNWLIEEINIW